MIEPTIQRIEIPPDERDQALYRLNAYWQTPCGEEVADRRAFNKIEKGIRLGYYERLIWPPWAKVADVERWIEFANRVLVIHRQGLV